MMMPVDIYLRVRPLVADFDQITNVLPDSGEIWDVGCGYGLLSNWLTTPSRNIVGVEPDTHRYQIARSRFESTNISFINQTAQAVALLPNSLDAVVFFDVLHHIPHSHHELILSRFVRALKPQGKLIIKEIATRPKYKYIINWLHDMVMTQGEPLFFRSTERWHTLLTQIGLQTTVQNRDYPAWFPYPHVCLVGEKS